MNILFLCVGNSARSQMAEGIGKKLLEGRGTVQSAGSEPKSIHPLAISSMKEIGIDISSQKSKSISTINPDSVDYIITLCAEEICPVFLKNVYKEHWPFEDPSLIEGNEDKKLEAFRKIRDELYNKIQIFITRNIR